jgi:hypothetical protein
MPTHDEPPEPARRVEADELPFWLPGEAVTRAMFELCREQRAAIRQYALDHGRGVGVVDRVSGAKMTAWPPPDLIVHRGE